MEPIFKQSLDRLRAAVQACSTYPNDMGILRPGLNWRASDSDPPRSLNAYDLRVILGELEYLQDTIVRVNEKLQDHEMSAAGELLREATWAPHEYSGEFE